MERYGAGEDVGGCGAQKLRTLFAYHIPNMKCLCMREMCSVHAEFRMSLIHFSVYNLPATRCSWVRRAVPSVVVRCDIRGWMCPLLNSLEIKYFCRAWCAMGALFAIDKRVRRKKKWKQKKCIRWSDVACLARCRCAAVVLFIEATSIHAPSGYGTYIYTSTNHMSRVNISSKCDFFERYEKWLMSYVSRCGESAPNIFHFKSSFLFIRLRRFSSACI